MSTEPSAFRHVHDPLSTDLVVMDPDRLFPPDQTSRSIARSIYQSAKDLPIISPHGHVAARVLTDDEPFADPSSLLITSDHYVTRLLHAQGVPLAQLGVGEEALDERSSRRIWRLLCENWMAFAGTPVRSWFESQLVQVFDVPLRPSATTADTIFDLLSERLLRPEFRPRALLERFGVEVLATTDDPADSLDAHRSLASDPSWSGRVIPTFRPDRYLELARPSWNRDVELLGVAARTDISAYPGFMSALESRRRTFIEHGATASDHGHLDARTEPMDLSAATRIYSNARKGDVTAGEADAFRRHMIFEMARMSCDDGLVMMLHPGIARDHHTPSFLTYGSDRGHDIPIQVEYTRALQPMLARFGTHPGFHLVLFTADETVYSREIAPLAGFYPSVFIGAPWWFLDAPDAMRRFRRAVTETAGFLRSAGFVDDTRAFCSIPVRHDTSRRIDSAFLADLVAQHQLPESEAMEIMRTITLDNPRRVFKL
jgi:glucuronate isomerase